MKNEPIIIIKKKGHGKHGHHGGAWKVAYADFVTAMMAFFLVMWLVAQSPQTKAAVGSYFRDPGAFETTRGGGVLTGGPSGMNDMPTPIDTDAAAAVLEQAASELRKNEESRPEFASLKDNIEIQLTPEGLLIELLESEQDGFFQVGSSGLKPESVKLLGVIATEIGKLPNRIAIEGHTDSRPYSRGEAFSNWELSSDRAHAARRAMQQQGLTKTQVEAVRGYADNRLRFKGRPLDARNRRISILVRRTDADGAKPPLLEGLTRGGSPASGPAASSHGAPATPGH